MAVTVIQNSCVAGAMFGLMASKYVGSFTPTDYTNIALTARAIADEFIVQNAVSAPIADADNAQIGGVVMEIAAATVYNSGAVSQTPSDYAAYGKQIYAASKEALTKLI
jgi:AICAR transformylase/IMP cyclohydrolase PurH